ncbi:MAG: hypothetical protein LUE31_09010 [Lachnospiraceae bacterium]|nr:hypothetical protein [Lachnospiraceae bacterium]
MGGFVGSCKNYFTIYYVTVSNSTVTAANGSVVGGVVGTSGYTYYCTAYKCTITASKNSAGGMQGSTPVQVRYCLVKDCIITAQNYAGGLKGYRAVRSSSFSVHSNVVDGCTITATTNYAGGLFGYNYTFSAYNNTVYNSTITAEQYAGGLAGYTAGGFYYNNAVDASITANSYVGSAFGYALNFYYSSSLPTGMALKCYDSYFVTDLSATSYVAGLIGSIKIADQPVDANGTALTSDDNYYDYMYGEFFEDNVLATYINSSSTSRD